MSKLLQKQGVRRPPTRSLGLVCMAVWALAGGLSFAQETPVAGLDSIAYRADRVEDDRRAGVVTFTGNVTIRYRDITLEASRVTYHRTGEVLIAEGVPDSTGAAVDGAPVFVRGNERTVGERMVYNLRTGRGTIRGGRAVYQQKHLRGEQLLLDPNRDVHARRLSLTSCDHEHPHYDFLCRDLKVVENDRAIGRSVTFRVGPVPVFWLPFFVFPMDETGRHSGVLTPSVGSNSRDGVFVRNLGYYYAPNDYWDAAARATFRERGGYLFETDVRYAVRDRLSGSVDVGFENDTRSPDRTRRNWRLNLTHQQRVSPSLGVRGSGQFTSSSNFDQINGDDAYSYLNRQLRSSFSVDKQWPDAGRSVDVNLSYFNDLTSDRNRFQGFPRVSFRQGRRPVFGERGIFYDLSGSVDNTFARGNLPEDDTEDLSIQGRLSLSSQHRPMGWLELTPGAGVTQLVSRNDQDLPTRRESYSAGVSTGATLYGLFHPRVGRLRGIRHRLQPRIGFRYNQSATVSGGTFGFDGVRTAGNASRTMDMSLTNAFEVKTEVDGKERRSTFATASLSTGFDFDSGVRNWQPLRTVASIKPDSRVDIRLSMSHLLEDDAGGFTLSGLDLQSLSVTSTFRFAGSRTEATPSRADTLSSFGEDYGFERNLYANAEDTSQPWRFSISHFYEVRDLGASDQTRSWLKSDLGVNPLPGWRINYGVNYDLVGRDLTAQSVSIYRSLHCWEASFSWYPDGFNRGFSFRINIKDIPQIGISHRAGGFGL